MRMEIILTALMGIYLASLYVTTAPPGDNIIKPTQSGELCEEITEFVVEGDNLSLQGEGDLPPPQTK